jgi:TonB family protein
MAKDARFWRNVTLIGLAHVAILVGLIRWSRETKSSNRQTIVWMNGGAGDGVAKTRSAVAPKPMKASRPPPEARPSKTEEAEDERPVLALAKSDIQLPAPASTTTPKPSATPKPAPKATPRPTPKPISKPTPKPTPKKTVLAKASLKPSPKAKPNPAQSENDEQADADAEKKKIAKAALAKNDAGDSNSSEKPVKKTTAAQTGSGKGTSVGANGHAGGGGSASKFGWYGSMLHDRFYSEWIQPTTVISSGTKLSALVKIRIEKDGRVSDFEIIKPSGNVVVDESVAATAKRVTQVDPLPDGIGSGGHYDVRINFELNSEE